MQDNKENKPSLKVTAKYSLKYCFGQIMRYKKSYLVVSLINVFIGAAVPFAEIFFLPLQGSPTSAPHPRRACPLPAISLPTFQEQTIPLFSTHMPTDPMPTGLLKKAR